MESIISISRKCVLSISLLLAACALAKAHPGHGIIGSGNEGIEHFISDPYHICWMIALTVLFFYGFVRLKKILRKSTK
jgi:hydrogenase/urease accessory protein HupE